MGCFYKENVLPVCIICRRVPVNGISGGLIIGKKLICYECENEIMSIPIDDVRYDIFRENIKMLWDS